MNEPFSKQIPVKLPLLFRILLVFYGFILPLASLYTLFINLIKVSNGFSTPDFSQIVISLIINSFGALLAILAYQRRKYPLFGLFILPLVRPLITFLLLGTYEGATSILISAIIFDLLLYISIYKRLKEFV